MARRRKNLSEKRNEEEKVSWAGEAAVLGLGNSGICSCIISLTHNHRWTQSIGYYASKLQNGAVEFQSLKRKPTPQSKRQKRRRKHSPRWSDG
jgi:hypothetical protein